VQSSVPLAIDRRCRIRSRKACNETVACVGKILFAINETGDNFVGFAYLYGAACRSSVPATRSRRSASRANTGAGTSFTAGCIAAAGSLSGKTLSLRPDRCDLRPRSSMKPPARDVARLSSRLSDVVAASRSAPLARRLVTTLFTLSVLARTVELTWL
jgi:hypothetical protein